MLEPNHPIYVIAVILLGSSCGGSPKHAAPPSAAATGAQPAGSSAQKTVAIKLPRILPAMPDGHILDLGPVLVPATGDAKAKPASYLLEAADRLGADAFVFEKQKLNEVYVIRTAWVRRWRDAYTGDVVNSTTWVYTGPLRLGSMPSTGAETGFYRAIRFLKNEPGSCDLDPGILGARVAAVFPEDIGLAEQLRVLSVLFAQGLIDNRTYREQRRQCLIQLEERESSVPATVEEDRYVP